MPYDGEQPTAATLVPPRFDMAEVAEAHRAVQASTPTPAQYALMQRYYQAHPISGGGGGSGVVTFIVTP